MERLHCVRLGVALALSSAGSLLAPTLGHAQNTIPGEYQELITGAQRVSALGAHPFGEHVDLYSGGFSFDVTDISVPGTGPTLQLSRSFEVGSSGLYENLNREMPFGDWDLDIPRIETYAADQADVQGWEVENAGNVNRCSGFNPPPSVVSSQGGDPWEPSQWWYGYHLIVPGIGDQALLAGVPANHSPTISGMSFVAGTKNDWVIACGVKASDGGEGFLAIAPDGTRYTFSQLVYRPMTALQKPLAEGTDTATTNPMVAPFNIIYREEAFMYVTKVEDRFGNTLTYNWDPNNPNNLASIVASDGRELDFAYQSGTPLVHTITLKSAGGAPARTWTYTYNINTSGAAPTLTSVQLPDHSAWTYSLSGLQMATFSSEFQYDICPGSGQLYGGGSATGSITAPSGLTGTFTVEAILHGRSYVPEYCIHAPGGTPGEGVPSIPDQYYQFSLTQEVLTGPGIPTETWNYSYSPAAPSWSSDACASSGTCAATVYTDVLDPDGYDIRYTFSNRFDASEEELLSVTDYSAGAGSATLRSTTNTYASPTGGPWPASYGIDLQDRHNHLQTEELAPLQTRKVSQDGATFTTAINGFDAFARAIGETESSSLGWSGSRAETTTYADDIGRWVLGMVKQKTVNGIIASQTGYDSLDRPISESAFGKLVSTKTWNSDGTLASVTDGDGNTTTFSGWYRGLPQTVTFADGTLKTAVVNGSGWITSLTDETGAVTSYKYDAMGRLAEIDYPSDSTNTWNATTLTFAPVTGSEYGIPAGHWKRTVQTGTGVTNTYFDAFWRPLVTEHYDSANKSGTLSQVVHLYDAAGRTIFASYPANNVTSYTQSLPGTDTGYDALNRVTTVVQDTELSSPSTTTTDYLPGFQTQVTNPRGYSTTTSYYAWGNPDTSLPYQITAPEGETTTITRDIYGKPRWIARNGNTYQAFVYDGYQQLCKHITNGIVTFDGWDNAGNLAWSAQGVNGFGDDTCSDVSQNNAYGRVVIRNYDARNRLTDIDFYDGYGTQQWSYTPDGLPAQVVTYNGGTAPPPPQVNAVTTSNGGLVKVVNSYLYDARRLLISENLSIPGQLSWTMGYGYDANGHLAVRFTPSGQYYTDDPDALGQSTDLRIENVKTYVSNVSHYPNGHVASFLWANLVKHQVTENVRGLPSEINDSSISDDPIPGGPNPLINVESLAYSYDADGNTKTVLDYDDGARSASMSYDGLDRLTSAGITGINGGATTTYQYDALDQITEASQGTHIQTFHYDTNYTDELTQVVDNQFGTTSFGYDVQGNLKQRGGVNYTFDLGNRLRNVAGQEGSYIYDAWGRRVAQTDVSGTIYSFYDRDGQLIYQRDRDSGTHDYLYLGSHLVAIRDYDASGVALSLRDQHTDALGSVIRQTDPSGQKIGADDMVYDAWGGVHGNPVQDGPGYTGHVEDADTNLVYMQQRYYDPSVGRFLSMDPVDASGTDGSNLDRYWYANDNPYRYTDPFGEQSVGEMIDSAAQGCGAVSCAGYAVLSAAWKLAGAEGLSQLADKGWSGSSTGDKVNAALSVAAVLPAARLLEGGADVVKVAIKTSGQLGKEGEAAVRAAQDIGPKVKIAINGRVRVPDGLTSSTLSEVKNVGKLSFTQQLRDYADFSQNTGRSFDLFTRPDTKLSQPLQDAIDQGFINHKHIPQL